MKKISTDIDIDCLNREQILEHLDYINASIHRTDKNVEKHPSGVYFQNIPHNPFTNMATMDHRVANQYGYFKVDFLNVSMYEGVRDEQHLIQLLNTEPDWDCFLHREITDELFHLRGHSRLLKRFKPQSVDDLAIILAIMRPAKAHLQQETWGKIRKEVWLKAEGDEGYQFKRSHAISYALAIVVNLNLLIEKLSAD